MKRATAIVVVLGLALAACGAGESTDTTGSPDTTGGDGTSGTSTLPPVDAPDEIFLTVTSEGGFIPVEFNLERMPRYMLLRDGTLFYQGPVPAIFPGPLLPNVQVTTVGADVRDEISLLLDELGIADIDEFIDDSGADMVADASTEVITYFDDNGAHRLGIYALGLTEAGASPERVLANELIQVLDDASMQGQSTTYQPERLQVAAGPAIEFDEGMSQTKAWPLDIAYGDMPEWGMGWRCAEIEGDAVASLFQTFSQANQATHWDTGDELVSIKARPLLPGEVACTGAPQG